MAYRPSRFFRVKFWNSGYRSVSIEELVLRGLL